MKRAVLLPSAKSDLLELGFYLAQASGSRTVSRRFVSKLRNYCHHLASLPFRMGVPRPNLAPELRSAIFENYVIFFRYIGERVEILNIVEGHRDIPDYFSSTNPE